MTQFIFTNNASTTLASAISAGSTTMTVASGAAFPVPAAGQQFAIWMTDAATGLVHEVMYATANASNQFTVIRGQEGTAAVAWAIGDYVQHVKTAGTVTPIASGGTGATTAPAALAALGAAPLAGATFTGDVYAPALGVTGGFPILDLDGGLPSLLFATGNYIEVPSGGGSMYFAAGGTAMVLNDAGQLAVTAGTSSGQAVNLGQFDSALSNPGWKAVADQTANTKSFIQQWGFATVTVNTSLTVTLPIAFVTTGLAATASFGATLSVADTYTVGIEIISDSQITITVGSSASSGTVGINWVVWGS